MSAPRLISKLVNSKWNGSAWTSAFNPSSLHTKNMPVHQPQSSMFIRMLAAIHSNKARRSESPRPRGRKGKTLFRMRTTIEDR